MQAFFFLGFKMAKSLQDWISFLDSIDINKIKLGLERMQEMLEALDLKPYLEKTLVIEVAGTNGKGSCASFLSECLRLSGVKVGLYTSPHLKHFTERVKISGKEVAESLLCEAFSEVKSISDLVSEYVSEVGKSSGAAMHMLWKEIAGKELDGIAEFVKEENGRIIISAKGPAAASLLALRKRKIISEFRRNFPDADITSMQIKRTY